ncbi:uncharacterized protein BXZ73DRAFT_88017 [Epithele typhae]|uniref:uncharacterized protein n=1 Tax=Epithele typhae TaxID=378194 RepID=UPI002007E82E|nr:uncharacterized protein BXZ73DRAFT_88017 [Epithele typhae]KAH9942444.1 hypothetical protein BXZ73DRAFT_88017 [Epithele typhae]
MSQPNAHKTKKRKHRDAPAAADAGAAPSPPAKRPKKDKRAKEPAKPQPKPKQDKGKGRATDDTFRVVRTALTVAVPPAFKHLRDGVEEMLDSMLMRYIPSLQGVVLAHNRLEFLDRTATIKAECPFANCRVAFDATVWSPQVGMKLSGRINLCSPDHVSLLVHRTFNVSIPRHHIRTDQYEFEYGPAENDPEHGVVQQEGEAGAEEQVDSGGRWVHHLTGEKLGGEKGVLEFTVVGMTIANQMVSLVGSIQPDPFSPDHVPRPTTSTATTVAKRIEGAGRTESTGISEREVDALIEDDDSDEEDMFQKLGRRADEAQRLALAKEEQGAKEKKRKRKEGKVKGKADEPTKERGKKKRKSMVSA